MAPSAFRLMFPVALSTLVGTFSDAHAAQVLPPHCNLEVSASGPGGVFPASGTGDGVFPTTLPSAPLISTLLFSPSAAVTEIDGVRLFGLTHTFIADLQFVLVDPNGNAYNLLTRLGNYSCDFNGDYMIAAPCACSGYGQTLPATCTGLNVLPNGSIGQWFGAWPDGANGIFNTTLDMIPPTAGVWALVIFDWAAGDVGVLGGWDIVGKPSTAPNEPPPPPNGCGPFILTPSTPPNNSTRLAPVTLSWAASASSRATTHRVRRKKGGDPDSTNATFSQDQLGSSLTLDDLAAGWWHWDVTSAKPIGGVLTFGPTSQPCRFCVPGKLADGACSILGAGGPIPTSGSGDGAWPGTLPSAPLVSTISVSVPPGATEIARLELSGITHSRIGDLHIVLTDPTGGNHNILHRVGHTGSGVGSSCDLLGLYSIGKDSRVVCPRWTGGCAPLLAFPSGDYGQDFGSWPSGTNGIFNTPIEFVPLNSGNWTLTIYDWAAGNTGSLTSWRLCFDVPSLPVSYCTAGTSTNGCVPAISGSGSASVSASSGFVLDVANIEGLKQGLFFYGVFGRASSPWAPGSTSFRCVKSPTQRMGALLSGGTPNGCDGAFSQDWLAYVAANPGALGAPYSAGQVVNAQAWYRDPLAVKTTNLSDGLEFTLSP